MPSAFRRAAATTVGADGTSSSTESTASTGSTTPGSSSSSSVRHPIGNRKGVRPGPGGTYRTSTGLSDLDRHISSLSSSSSSSSNSSSSGGQRLETCLLVKEDRFAVDLTRTLVKYWCAEAISQGQHLRVPVWTTRSKKTAIATVTSLEDGDDMDGDEDDWDDNDDLPSIRAELVRLLSSLPRNLHWDKQRKKESQRQQQQTKKALETSGSMLPPTTAERLDAWAEEDENDEDEEDDTAAKDLVGPLVDNNNDDDDEDDEGLQNAWQYKKSVQLERSGKKSAAVGTSTEKATAAASNVFCHSYDLSGRMADQMATFDPSHYLVELPSPCGKNLTTKLSVRVRGFQLFQQLIKVLTQRKKDEKDDEEAIRLLLFHPLIDVMAVALPLLLAHIRNESLPVVILICTPTTIDTTNWMQLARTSDIVLATEGFASRSVYPPPAEFRHLQGVLQFYKTTQKLTDITAWVYGCQRDRRKLHIPLLHIPPEDYTEGGGGSVGSGGVRSGAGRKPSSSCDNGGAGGSTAGQNRRGMSSGGMGCASNLSGSALDF